MFGSVYYPSTPLSNTIAWLSLKVDVCFIMGRYNMKLFMWHCESKNNIYSLFLWSICSLVPTSQYFKYSLHIREIMQFGPLGLIKTHSHPAVAFNDNTLAALALIVIQLLQNPHLTLYSQSRWSYWFKVKVIIRK